MEKNGGGRVAAGRRWRDALRDLPELGVLAALLALVTLFSLSAEHFFEASNLIRVARQASYYGIMATGMVFVLTLGEVDLSVGSILTLVNVAAAAALREGAPPILAVALGLGLGAACGLLNGALSVILRLPTIIVTLGTLSAFRGIALVLSKATPISLPREAKEGPLFRALGGELLHVPASVVAMLLVGLLGSVLLRRTVFGRRVEAIGGNLQAARFSGIRIARHRLAVMTLSGALAALAGILALAFLQAADPSTGKGFELFVIASAVIGGTALSGGSGSVAGGILGALILAVIGNGLILLGLTGYWTEVVTGGMIIAAVALDRCFKRK